MTFTEDTHLSISKGDEQREEKTKEEMQKNVLSIRGEDRRYWKYPIVWIFVIWKLISLRTEPHCPKVIMSAIPDGRNFSFRISMVWVHNGCAWERTSQEEGDLQVRKIFSKDLKIWQNITSSDTRRHGQYSAWTGRWGQTRGSDWLSAPLSRSTTTRSRLSGKVRACFACRPFETFFDI